MKALHTKKSVLGVLLAAALLLFAAPSSAFAATPPLCNSGSAR